MAERSEDKKIKEGDGRRRIRGGRDRSDNQNGVGEAGVKS